MRCRCRCTRISLVPRTTTGHTLGVSIWVCVHYCILRSACCVCACSSSVHTSLLQKQDAQYERVCSRHNHTSVVDAKSHAAIDTYMNTGWSTSYTGSRTRQRQAADEAHSRQSNSQTYSTTDCRCLVLFRMPLLLFTIP